MDLKATSVGFAAEGEAACLNCCVSVKTDLFRFKKKRSLPDELAGGITQGPKDIKIQPPHVASKKLNGQAAARITLVQPGAPVVTSDWLIGA